MKRLALSIAALAVVTPLHAQVPAQSEPPQTAAAAPSAADFGALPFLRGPKISPDGTRVAAIGQIDGEQIALIADMSGKGGITRWSIPKGTAIRWVRWAGNDRILLSVSSIQKIYDTELRVTRVHMIELSTGRQDVLGPTKQGLDGDDILHIDPAGKFALLSTLRGAYYSLPQVYRIDLDTGKSKIVAFMQYGIYQWFADNNGVVRAGLGSDGDKWWITYRDVEGGDFKRTLTRKLDAKDTANGIDSFVPVVGSDQGYAIAQGKTGHLALYRYDFKADQLGELLYESPSVDIDDFDLTEKGALEAVYYTDEHAEIAWFDPALKTLQAALDGVFPGMINRVVSMSQNKRRLIVWTGGANDPGAYYVFDRDTRRMVLLSEPYEELRGKQLATVQPVRYKARDGLEIRAYLTLPPGKESATGLPLVVMPHGGPFLRDEWEYDEWAQFVASRGYAVLQPNFRGSTGLGKDFVEKGYGQWGRGMQDDIDDGVKWLASTGRADIKRVCIMGGSFGGYAAMWAAVRNPELYRCAISFAGISDMGAMLQYDREFLIAPRYYRDWRRKIQGEDASKLSDISPIAFVQKMTVPILIAHGTDDDVVPVSQSRRLHLALTQLNRAHEYVIYPDEGHGFDKPEDSIDFLKRVEAFLKKYNPS